MVDSGATGNFVSERVVSRTDLPTRQKDDPYDLSAINGEALTEGVTTETLPLQVAIQHHHEKLVFDVTRMAIHDVVLGML